MAVAPQIVNEIRNGIRDDWDAVIAVTGDEGVGKSRCAIYLAELIDHKFDYENNIMFQPSSRELKMKLTGLPRYSAIVIDEAFRVLYKLRWSDKAQLYLKTVYALCREENQVSLLCMPRFIDFDENFRCHRIKLWVYVYERGKAVVFGGRKTPGGSLPKFDYEAIDELFDKECWKEGLLQPNEEVINNVAKRCRNFVCKLRFPDFEPDKKALYKKMKKAAAYMDLEKELLNEDEPMNVQRGKLALYLHNFLGLDFSGIAAIINMNESSLRASLTTVKPFVTETELQKCSKLRVAPYKEVILLNNNLKRSFRDNLNRIGRNIRKDQLMKPEDMQTGPPDETVHSNAEADVGRAGLPDPGADGEGHKERAKEEG